MVGRRTGRCEALVELGVADGAADDAAADAAKLNAKKASSAAAFPRALWASNTSSMLSDKAARLVSPVLEERVLEATRSGEFRRCGTSRFKFSALRHVCCDARTAATRKTSLRLRHRRSGSGGGRRSRRIAESVRGNLCMRLADESA